VLDAFPPPLLTAKQKLEDRLAAAAREKLAQASKESKEKQLQAERKRKAALFLQTLRAPGAGGPDKAKRAALDLGTPHQVGGPDRTDVSRLLEEDVVLVSGPPTGFDPHRDGAGILEHDACSIAMFDLNSLWIKVSPKCVYLIVHRVLS